MKTIQALLITACAMFVSFTPSFAQAKDTSNAATQSVKVGLLVRLEAKKGKEDELAKFLISGKNIVDDEPATSTWFAIRMSPSSFGIFDTFPNDEGRNAHLAGKVAAALMAKAPDLLATPPVIEKLDVLAVKLGLNGAK
jgi:quinol monooxygenase YgiN